MFADAQAYERFMGRWSRRIANPFLDFATLPEKGSVLDVGSGTGSLSLAIAERRPEDRTVGIDPSAEYVAYAKSRQPSTGRAEFEVGDAQQLRFPNASFDGALALLVVNFIPDPAKALRELRRVTRPGGLISAAVWDYGAGMRMLRIFWDAAVATDPSADTRDEKHMPLCRFGELSTLWRSAGLRDVREQPVEITLNFTSFADYWDPFLLGQGPAGAYARSLSHDRLETLRLEVKRRVGVAEGSPFDLPARVWAVSAAVPRG